MDLKALAKSKRAHSHHLSKRSHANHHIQNLKPSSSSSTSNEVSVTAEKPLRKQVKEKTTHRSQGSSGLPTNWDRYEEEFESGPEGVSPESARKTDDVVLPKSKGADFRYLVSEAQSQVNSTLEGIPSLDDVLPGEFNVGLSSMLAVRGEGILSWIGDDNFVVEDKTSGTHEASFLSLNLHALAENLEKVDLSKRLFVEPDLLPPELCVEGSPLGCNEQPDKVRPTDETDLAIRMSEELTLDEFVAEKNADQFTSSSSRGSSRTASAFTLSDDVSIAVNHVGIEFPKVGDSDENKAFDQSAEANLHSTEHRKTEISTFEAPAAEEELDMLLDSFSETKDLDSRGFKSNPSVSVLQGVTSVDPPRISNKEPVSSKIASISATLDDALDDLLEETSTLVNPNVLTRPQEKKSILQSTQSSLHSGSNSKVSDDFDSWFDTL